MSSRTYTFPKSEALINRLCDQLQQEINKVIAQASKSLNLLMVPEVSLIDHDRYITVRCSRQKVAAEAKTQLLSLLDKGYRVETKKVMGDRRASTSDHWVVVVSW